MSVSVRIAAGKPGRRGIRKIKFDRFREDGAGCRVRTRDPLITNQVLYQLS